MNEIESLNAQIRALTQTVNIWNTVMLWGLAVAALAAVVVGLSTRLVVVRTGQLGDAQDMLIAAKDRQLQLDLKEKDRQIAVAAQGAANATEKAAAAQGNVAGLQENAANAKLAQQELEVELAKQKEKTALAEANVAQLQGKIQWRTITDEQQSKFVTSTATIPKGVLLVIAMDGDPESVAFAVKLGAMFSKAGWTPEISSFLSVGSTPVGLILQVRSTALVTPDSPLFHAAILQKALEAVGLPSSTQELPSLPVGTVQLMVGHKL